MLCGNVVVRCFEMLLEGLSQSVGQRTRKAAVVVSSRHCSDESTLMLRSSWQLTCSVTSSFSLVTQHQCLQ